ncbi:hypothetical protein [Aeromicrobium sp. CF3.5]|uniref:hypothetical protein n=1 Tax=Aeromicrobium sp. CF3.5 TaxID=3373078 RepID=UPI003EE51AF5
MTNWRGAREPASRAERLTLKPWTDPRLLLGVLLVLAATVGGARLVALGDESVQYWAVASDVRAGTPLVADHLEARPVELSGASAERYLRVDDELPAAMGDLQWDRDVTSGELLDGAALVDRGLDDLREVPLTVTEGAAPANLRAGDQVEIWVGPGPGDTADQTSLRVLADARVIDSGGEAGSLGGALARTVLVRVPAAQVTGETVSTIAAGHVTVVRVG